MVVRGDIRSLLMSPLTVQGSRRRWPGWRGQRRQLRWRTECGVPNRSTSWTRYQATDDSATKVSSETSSLPFVSGLNSSVTKNTIAAPLVAISIGTRSPMAGGGEVGQHRAGEARQDRPLMIAEARGRRPHLGRKPLGQIVRILSVIAPRKAPCT